MLGIFSVLIELHLVLMLVYVLYTCVYKSYSSSYIADRHIIKLSEPRYIFAEGSASKCVDIIKVGPPALEDFTVVYCIGKTLNGVGDCGLVFI